MNWLSRIKSEPVHAPAGWQLQNQNELLQQLISPVTPTTAAKTRDPNAPDYRYQVNQKCIYERELPGGSYITAHLQRLQSGYYDSDVVHEDLIENVRFVAINFVFHPSRKDYRFKSAEISVAIHHARENNVNPFDKVRNSIGIPDTPGHEHDHSTQTDTVSNALIRSTDVLPRPQQRTKASTCRPKFIRHAPHLLYGSISPETLNWNFNLAGSVGVSQGPAGAAFKPSYGSSGSYKVYEMMRVQGSVRTLRSWYGHKYDVEDGEIVWTLEENKLQKSGLPREFTFVMMLTKGSGGIEPSDDITLDIDIHPKVSGPAGGTYPKFVTGMNKFQPFPKDPVNLDQEIGQVFEPSIRGRGFNFATLATSFDDFVWLPGTTYSASDNPYAQTQQTTAPQQQSQPQPQQVQLPQAQNSRHRQLASQPSTEQTLNLRVILENARGSPVHMNGIHQLTTGAPFVQLKPPSRNPSPLPRSVAGSHRSKRSITITSQAPGSSRTASQRKRHSYAGSQSQSQSQSRQVSGASASNRAQVRQVSHAHSLRKTRSRSGLDKEYIRSESPEEQKALSQTFHDARAEISPQSQSQSLAESDGVSVREVEPPVDATPRHADETLQRDVDPDTGGQTYDYPTEAAEQDAEESDQLASITPSRKQRFPSLSQTHSQRQKARQQHALVTNPGLAPPRTPPPPSSVYSAQPLALQSTQETPPPLPEESNKNLVREEPETGYVEEQRDPDLETRSQPDQESSTPPPIQSSRTQPEDEPGREPTTPPPIEVHGANEADPLTPPNPQPRQSMENPEPTLDPESMLDPSTPKWHQHTSSPPSGSTTAPIHFDNFSSGSKSNPSNATPRAAPKQALNYTDTGNWNDTPPEWASPSASGSNTPTRNRSLRTRKATARALAYQDQVEAQRLSQSLSASTADRGTEQYRAPNVAMSGRGNSLHISAGPNARHAKNVASPPTSYRSKQASTSAASNGNVTDKSIRYSYPSVPAPASTSQHARTQSQNKPSGRSHSEEGYRSSPSNANTNTGKSHVDVGTSIGFPSATPTSKAVQQRQLADSDQPSSYPPPISSPLAPKLHALHQSGNREGTKKIRDAQAQLARAEKVHAQAKLAQRYGKEAGYWGHDANGAHTVETAKMVHDPGVMHVGGGSGNVSVDPAMEWGHGPARSTRESETSRKASDAVASGSRRASDAEGSKSGSRTGSLTGIGVASRSTIKSKLTGLGKSLSTSIGVGGRSRNSSQGTNVNKVFGTPVLPTASATAGVSRKKTPTGEEEWHEDRIVEAGGAPTSELYGDRPEPQSNQDTNQILDFDHEDDAHGQEQPPEYYRTDSHDRSEENEHLLPHSSSQDDEHHAPANVQETDTDSQRQRRLHQQSSWDSEYAREHDWRTMAGYATNMI